MKQHSFIAEKFGDNVIAKKLKGGVVIATSSKPCENCKFNEMFVLFPEINPSKNKKIITKML